MACGEIDQAGIQVLDLNTEVGKDMESILDDHDLARCFRHGLVATIERRPLDNRPDLWLELKHLVARLQHSGDQRSDAWQECIRFGECEESWRHGTSFPTVAHYSTAPGPEVLGGVNLQHVAKDAELSPS